MISAQHSSNNGKKLSYMHGNIFNEGKMILSRFKLTS